MPNIDYELNKKNNELQVIYKRNHGGYGLIQSK